ncbi:hypothetical protein ACOMHN_067254 [Nucella lapillus]
MNMVTIGQHPRNNGPALPSGSHLIVHFSYRHLHRPRLTDQSTDWLPNTGTSNFPLSNCIQPLSGRVLIAGRYSAVVPHKATQPFCCIRPEEHQSI